jgi:tRNA modification GTPase
LNGSTIVAPATCPGPGAVSIIRISGEASLAVCDSVFRGKCRVSEAPDRSVTLGEIVGADGSPIDQVLVIVMRGPHSLTGEDVVEVCCHGGSVAPRLVLRRLVEAGAEPAVAGEFTKRAFLNGKMDLAQAEAVADIVRAGGEHALRSAVRQLRGDLSVRLRRIETALLESLASLEAGIDFPEEEETAGIDPSGVLEGLGATHREMEALLAAHERGRHISQGLDVAIVGSPNVGKSSLFNRLVGEDRVIVGETPGTTRDVVDGSISLDGVMVHLHDTAGLGPGVGPVEEQAVDRTRRAMTRADLALVVIDASRPLTHEDRELLGSIASKPHLVVANKTDLGPASGVGDNGGAVRISALKDWGIDEVRKMLKEYASGGVAALDSEIVVSERHAGCIRSALGHITRGLEAWQEGLSQEFTATDIRHALEAIGEVTGRKISRSVLDEIFSKFCIGK